MNAEEHGRASVASAGFEIESRIKKTVFAGKLHHLELTHSTNDVALEAAAKGAPEGSVFYADQQSAGRGRGRHTWQSEPGTSLLLSVLLRPRIAPLDALKLSLMAGVATHRAVTQITGLKPDLRWPNDLLLGGKKFCGILAEQASEGGAVRHAVIGIGLNLNQRSFPEELAGIATSLRLVSGQEWSRDDMLAAVLVELDAEYRALLAELAGGSTAELFARVQACSSYVRDKQVHVDEAGGYEGVTAGLDERGFLRVRTETGMRTVVSGGVREVARR